MIQDFILFFKLQVEPVMLPFSIPMAICMLYWLMMIVGFLDMEIIDSLLGFGDGAADGAVDGALEGIADGAAEGAADSTIEAAGESLGFLASFMGFLNFGHAPATIIITLFAFFMWILANIGRMFFAGTAGVSATVMFGIFLATFTACFIISSVITHFAGKPFKKLMAICTYRGGIHLTGKVCVVRSRRVTSKSGQIELTPDGGSPLILHAICDHDNDLKRGDKAVIIEYDKGKDLFVIEPMF